MSCVVERVLPNLGLTDDTLTYIARRFYPDCAVENLVYINSEFLTLNLSSTTLGPNQVMIVTCATGRGNISCFSTEIVDFFNGYYLAFNKISETVGFNVDLVYHIFQWND